MSGPVEQDPFGFLNRPPPEPGEHERTLRANLKARGDELRALWESVNDHWGYEDSIYRFYHQSFKVFRLQEVTLKIVATLESLLPERPLNPWFLEIVREGTGRQFSTDDNARWLAATRPIVEAFFHARYFLELCVRYPDPPVSLFIASGWASLLTLYGIR